MCRASALLCAVALLAGCGGGSGAGPAAGAPPPAVRVDPAGFSGARALREVEAFLQVGPRVSGTPGARRAADWIAERLAGMGLKAEVDRFTDPTPSGPVEFHNVTAVRPGPAPGLILLSGHFDAKEGIAPDFQGANDGGSSTGALLELARVYAGAEWRGPTILFAFFDGEECRFTYSDIDGLHGSRRLAGKLKVEGRAGRVIAQINLDMIGDRDLGITLPSDTPPRLARIAFQAAVNIGRRRHIGYASGPVLDDHVPFQRIGIPAVDLIDFQYGSRPGENDLWHTPADTLDKLSAESLETAGRLTVEMVNLLLSDAYADPPRTP